MRHDTTITLQQAQEIVIQCKAQAFEKYKELKESFCDLFDRADFQYYADETGLKLETVYKLAKFHDSSIFWVNIEGEYFEINT